MSLIAHFPLTENILDYTNLNKTYKIGTLDLINDGIVGSQCYKFNNTNNGVKIINNFSNLKDFTICAWVKPAGEHKNYTGAIISSGNWNLFRNFWNIGISQNNSYLVWHKTENFGNYNFPVDRWTHIAITYKRYTYNSCEYISYINGKFVKKISSARTDNVLSSDVNYSCIGRETYSSGYFSFNGCISDVRIYDNELSKNEIKDVYKSLILHLDFNNPYEKYTKNLIQTFSPHGCSKTLLDEKYNYSPVYRIKVTKPNIGNNFGIRGDIATNIPTGITKVSISFMCRVIKSPKNLRGYIRILYTDNTRKQFSWIYQPYIFNDKEYINKWCKVSSTIDISLSDKVPKLIEVIYIYKNAKDIECMDISELQLEFGHPSPYTPNERYDEVYDISGYRNNGKLIHKGKTPDWTKECFSGNGSFLFRKKHKDYVTLPMNCKIRHTITVNIILKMDDYSEFKRSISCTEGGGWNFEKINDSPIRFVIYKKDVGYLFSTLNISCSELSGWVMLTGTYDGQYAKIYLNGILKDTKGNSSYKPIKYNENNTIFLNAEAGNNLLPIGSGHHDMLLDDVRIYGTALSDEDILDLYETKLMLYKNKTIKTNNVIEPINMFDLEYIYNLGLSRYGDKPKREIHYGVPSIGICANNFYKSDGNYDEIMPKYINLCKYKFKENTQYLVDIFLCHKCFYNEKPVSGGIVIYYTDNTKKFCSNNIYDKWNRIRLITDKNKSISKLVVHYYTGYIVWYSLDSKIVEFTGGLDSKGNLLTTGINEIKPYKPTLCDYSNWKLDNGIPDGFDSAGHKDTIKLLGNPHGQLDYIWAGDKRDEIYYTSCGLMSKFNYDKNKKYRVSIWVKKDNISNGVIYAGLCNHGSISNIGSDHVNMDPYFVSNEKNLFKNGDWLLLVGIIFPQSYRSNSYTDSGIYNINGEKILQGRDYRWSTSYTGKSLLRVFLYQSDTVDETAYFYRPRIEVCDGTEPTIKELTGLEEHSSIYLSENIDDVSIDKYNNIYCNKIIKN